MPIDINADRLEPDIPSVTNGTSHDGLVLMAYSQAISLKRIADSLDRLTALPADRTTVQQFRDSLAEAEAALHAATTDDNPWIDWPGGECPVPDGTWVDVRHRDGEVRRKQRATSQHEQQFGTVASRMFWRHDSLPLDIVAYRISK